MSTAELKTNIYQLLNGITDDSVLQAIYALLSKVSSNAEDWADQLPADVLGELMLSIKDADKGDRGISHAEMIAEARKEFPNLKI